MPPRERAVALRLEGPGVGLADEEDPAPGVARQEVPGLRAVHVVGPDDGAGAVDADDAVERLRAGHVAGGGDGELEGCEGADLEAHVAQRGRRVPVPNASRGAHTAGGGRFRTEHRVSVGRSNRSFFRRMDNPTPGVARQEVPGLRAVHVVGPFFFGRCSDELFSLVVVVVDQRNISITNVHAHVAVRSNTFAFGPATRAPRSKRS